MATSYSETKKAIDATKIQEFERSGRFKHIYCYDEWRDWTGNNYIKSWYDVLLPDGTIWEHVRPNAGVLHVGHRRFEGNSGVKVRLSQSFPF